jgi:hypothetical protein
VITVAQLAIAGSIPTIVALIGILYNASAVNKMGDRLDKLADKVDRGAENFNNQVTTLLSTIHGV